jgi:glucosylceramidase
MQEAGVPIQAVTTQNEPEATQVWESCRFDAEDELRLVNHLHAAFEREKMDIKILIWDHNRDRVVERADAILRKVPEKVWGVGYHWYMGEDAENLAVVHDLYPDHHLLFTEGCVELTHTAAGAEGGGKDKWKNAEFYGRNIIKDSLNYSEGFVDWNLLLNEQGGPNHVGNFCEAPLMYDRDRDVLTYNPSYYYIGHFSRHIEPGAVRVHVNASKDPALFATAYKNPNGAVVIVIQNEGWIKQRTLVVDGKRVEISLPPFSITTFVVKG